MKLNQIISAIEMQVRAFNSKITQFIKRSQQQEEEEGARTRSEQIKLIFSTLNGALGEFYKGQLAEKNGDKYYADSWSNETDKLLISIKKSLAKLIERVKNHDLAYQEIVQLLRDEDHTTRKWATGKMSRYNPPIKVIHHLNDEDFSLFRGKMDEIYNEILDE